MRDVLIFLSVGNPRLPRNTTMGIKAGWSLEFQACGRVFSRFTRYYNIG